MNIAKMQVPDPGIGQGGLAFFLLGLGILVLLLILVLKFFLFAAACKKTAKRLEEYVYYILEGEDSGEAREPDMAPLVTEEKTKEGSPPLTKGQQEALLQEILGGFLS